MSSICSISVEAGKLYYQIPLFSFYPSKFHLVSRKLIQKHVFGIEYSATSGRVMCLQTQSLQSNSNLSIQHSPTVSYLVNRCGLPLDSAISASAKIHLEATDRPDSVLHLLKTYDFTQTQITKLITKSPNVILLDPVGTIKPIFENMELLGLSKPEIADFISSKRVILERNLEHQIIPVCSLLKSYLHTKKDILIALHRWTFLPSVNYERCQNNVAVLRDLGIPDINISKFIVLQPRAVREDTDRFKEIVKEVEKMKIDPNRPAFVHAIASMGAMSKSLWEKKIEIYKSFGLSEEEFISAFKKRPGIVVSSEKKILKLMDFYMNVLGFTSFNIIQYPNLMLISYEKNLLPRCSVLSFLLSNGLIKSKLNLPRVLSMSKDQFEKEYVNKYQEYVNKYQEYVNKYQHYVNKYQVVAPEVLKVYQGEVGYPNLEALRVVLCSAD